MPTNPVTQATVRTDVRWCRPVFPAVVGCMVTAHHPSPRTRSSAERTVAPVTVAGTVCDAVRGAAGRPVGCSGRVSGEATMSDDGLFADPAQPAPASFPATITAAPRFDPNAPLAARMRPRSLDEVIGQQHLLGAGAPLRRLVHGGAPSSMLLYGPPGTGKTTLATLVAGATGRRFAQLSAIAAGVKEVRAVIEQARYSLRSTGEQTVLFIDEVHRFNKAQQDSLLGAVEDRTVILIGATTENPFFSVVSPLLSRSLILQLQPLTDADIVEVLTPGRHRRPRVGRPGDTDRRGARTTWWRCPAGTPAGR